MKIAIYGLGIVGFGVYDILTNNEFFDSIMIKWVLDKDVSKKDLIKNSRLTANLDEILNDKEVSLVVETMGAGEFSYHAIKQSLLKGKHVITANKEVIALHLEELTKIKKEKNVSLYFEASVGGGIPLIAPLIEISKTNEFKTIKGILNGTTNFILTKMQDEDLSFEEAVKLAQLKGFAEANPSADLRGLDMVRKIVILSMIAFKMKISVDNVYHYGIENLKKEDIISIRNNDYILKLVAASYYVDNKLSLIVEPILISKTNVLANVKNEFNYCEVDCSINGLLGFYGKGAGRYPTANAMVNDIISVIENKENYTFKNVKLTKIAKFDRIASYYIRYKSGEVAYIKSLERNKLLGMLGSIEFYARIEE